MKKSLYKIGVLLLFLACMFTLSAQTKKDISGTVTDETGEPLIGVSIAVKNQPGIGTITDVDGKFRIKVGAYDVLLVKYIGYTQQEVPVAEGKFNIVMQEEKHSLKEVVVMGAGGVAQRKVTLSGAISSVDVKSIKAPTANLSNALVGNVAGIIGRQSTGEPGQNTTEFWVRGISTFGANDRALILVDGIERPLDQLNVEDIESFSVLKDASATAIYGSRGANGVVLITTKHGEAGKVNINFKSEYGYNTPSRLPEYADGYTYATMANEAQLSRYQQPIYTDQELEIIKHNLDPDLFPDVNWQDVLLKDGTSNYRATLSLSGGANTARYYVSGSYYNDEGMYKVQNINKYSSNISYERINYRANVDMDITPTTLLKMGVSGFQINQTKPRISADDTWKAIANLTPLTVPRIYSNGRIPAYGSGLDQISPEVQINRMGYVTRWENKAETNITLEQDLKSITPGLRFIGMFSFDTENYTEITRKKDPELWYADKIRSAEGDLVMTRRRTETLLSQSAESNSMRRYYTEAKLDYSRLFGDHRVSALLLYFQQEKAYSRDAGDVKKSIPYRNMSLSGRTTYSFKDRYLAEFNFGYTGSENFEPGHQFGFFPAVSGGWVISEEPWVKYNLDWLNMFKIRYSYGKTGNDKIQKDDGSEERFPYLSFVTNSDGYKYGEYDTNGKPGFRITTIGATGLIWETSIKHNLGVDLVLWDNKISLTADIFRDHRRDIFKERGLMPYSTGLQDIKAFGNIGEMESSGIDGVGSYTDKIGNVTYTIRGNFTLARTNVINYDEADNALAYQMTKGYRWNQTRGYIALGLFKDQEDIDTSPTQEAWGSVLPGDIKYKDVNGDGIIDSKDEVPMGYTKVPNLVYGAGLSLGWKQWDFNMLVQGAGQSDFFLEGKGVWPFSGEREGNILTQMTDPNSRWISREISGDPVTERADALLPRLSYGNTNSNNLQHSTFWLRDGSYMRLKNVELGYTLPVRYAKKLYAESVRVGFIGYNLLVFSPFKWWDPEIGSSDGAKYPISKTYSFNLIVNF